jgi:hypothetical protein
MLCGFRLSSVLEFQIEGRPTLIILKLILKKQDEKVWTGLIWLKIGTYDELL